VSLHLRLHSSHTIPTTTTCTSNQLLARSSIENIEFVASTASHMMLANLNDLIGQFALHRPVRTFTMQQLTVTAARHRSCSCSCCCSRCHSSEESTSGLLSARNSAEQNVRPPNPPRLPEPCPSNGTSCLGTLSPSPGLASTARGAFCGEAVSSGPQELAVSAAGVF